MLDAKADEVEEETDEMDILVISAENFFPVTFWINCKIISK